MIALDGRNVYVRSNAPAAINGPSAISQLHLAVRRVVLGFAAIVVIVVERDVAIVALDKASARSVVVSGGERQSGVFGQRVHGLHQTLAERDFANDQTAVVILDRARNNFSRRSRQAIHENDNRIVLATVAMLRDVALLGRGATVMRNDELSLLQELVSDANAFAEQAARI